MKLFVPQLPRLANTYNRRMYCSSRWAKIRRLSKLAAVRCGLFRTKQTSAVVATYFQAADLYLHAAKADTFPNVVLEALACGTPIIATAVGGISEQIKGLTDTGMPVSKLDQFGADEATGVLVKAGDASAMAIAGEKLLKDESLRCRLAHNAANDARRRFDLNREVLEYLDWYRQLVENRANLRQKQPM